MYINNMNWGDFILLNKSIKVVSKSESGFTINFGFRTLGLWPIRISIIYKRLHMSHSMYYVITFNNFRINTDLWC